MLSDARVQQICHRVAFRWQTSVPDDYRADLAQIARAYELEHQDEPFFIGNLYQHLHDACAALVHQTSRADNRGLRVLRNGKKDVSWLIQASPGPESEVFAKISLMKLWNRSTEVQRMAISCLALADLTDNGGVRPEELGRFGIPSSRALWNRLAKIRKKGHP